MDIKGRVLYLYSGCCTTSLNLTIALFYSRSGANYPGLGYLWLWPGDQWPPWGPASDVTEVIIHYPWSPSSGNTGLWLCHTAKYTFVAHLDPGIQIDIGGLQSDASKLLTIPSSLDEQLWFIHPHQFWTWKISDDTRLLFNCTGSGDKKSSGLIIIRLTTENWKWLFVSLA